MKKFLISVFAIFITFSVYIEKAEAATTNDLKNGDFVRLNGYDFIVLDKNERYLILKDNLEHRAFAVEGGYKYYNPLEDGNIAKYLNTVFLNNLGAYKGHIKNMDWEVTDRSFFPDLKVQAKIGMLSIGEFHTHKSLVLPRIQTYTWSRTTFLDSQNKDPENITHVLVYYTDGRQYRQPSTDSKTTAVKPTIYLEEGKEIIGGLGNENDPYLLKPEKNQLEIRNLALLKDYLQ